MQAKKMVKEAGDTHVLRPILCLDLDKTLRRNKYDPIAFINRAEDQELMPGMLDRIERFKMFGYLTGIVTNQGGVAHGKKTEYSLSQEMSYLYGLITEAGYAPGKMIDSCLFAGGMENGRVEPFCHRSLWRKPSIGMLAEFERIFFKQGIVIDWNHSLMVGDQEEDSQLAANASINFYHIDAFLNLPVESIVAMVQADQT